MSPTAPLQFPASTATLPRSPLLLLLRVNWLQMLRRARSLREQSRLLTSVIALFIGSYFILAFRLFHWGLQFIATFPGLGEILTERLLYLLFAFLFGMLLLSNLVIGYTNLFRNRETAFLWTLPVPANAIFQWKFLETSVLASWAFVFLISPLLLAFGMIRHAEWHFYALTPFMVGIYIVLPTVLGMWLAINLARFIDRKAFQIIIVTMMGALLAAAAIWFRPQPAVDEEATETRVLVVVDQLLDRTKFAQFALLPSYWLSTAVRQWSEGALSAAGFFLLVLLSNVLLFGFAALTRLGDSFYQAASMVQSRGSVFGRWEWFKKRSSLRGPFGYGRGPVDWFFDQFFWLTPDTRAVLAKDVRMFWRDTTQWGQTAVLFGLLGFYIINLRHFMQQMTAPFWIHLVSYLNLGACSLNLATLTTRFVYPQFSLEGRRLWIVGIAPIGLPRLLRIKLWLTTCGTMVVTLGLVWLSCHLIQLPWERTLFFAVAVIVMTFTLNAMAAGIGALYPNLREDNPGKIVSGFGGTLCLVLSFVYILVSILLLAMASPWWSLSRGWLYAIARVVENASSAMGWNEGQGIQLAPELLAAVCWVGFLALSIAVGWLPFRLGLRKVAKFEF
jgi:ABC-2 type transport system permease protein